MASGPYLPTLPVSGTALATSWGDAVVHAINYYQGTPASGDDIRPYAVLYQSIAQALTTGTATSILMDQESIDTKNGHSTTTNTSRWTCPLAGWYHATFMAGFAANATGDRAAWIHIQSTSSFRVAELSVPAATTNLTYLSGSDRFYLNVGDYVELQMDQTSGGSLNTDVSAAGTCRLTIAQELMQ